MTEPATPDRALGIGLVVRDFPILSETFIALLAAGLVERGQDVRILALEGRGASPEARSDLVRRHDLEALTHRPAARRLLIDPFLSAGARWSPPRRAAAFAAQAPMLARQPRFDVLHCQFATLALALTTHRKLRLVRASKLVLHLRGADVSRDLAGMPPGMRRRLFEEADLMIGACAYFRDRAIALGAPPGRTIAIGSPIDTGLFVPRRFDPESTAPPRLLSVGRLVEKKGFEYAIRSLARLADEFPGIGYDIVGDGPLRSSLAGLIRELDLGNRVHLLGERPHAETVALLAGADILLAPSVTARSGDQDGTVNAVKEAMATGLPVIASRHGGIPELVEDGLHGALVPERDPDAIADALRRLVARRADWAGMGRQGRARVVEMYDRDRVADQLLAAYRGLFAR